MRFESFNVFEGLDSITIPIPETFRDCVLLARSDYFRYTGKCNPTLLKMLWYSVVNYNFAFCLWFRLAKVKSFYFAVARLMLECTCRHHGLSFSRNVKCGYGLHIVHAIGIIVNATTVIGNNFQARLACIRLCIPDCHQDWRLAGSKCYCLPRCDYRRACSNWCRVCRCKRY